MINRDIVQHRHSSRINKGVVQGDGFGDMLLSLGKTLAPILLPAVGNLVGQVADSGGKRLGKMIEGDGIVLSGNGLKMAGQALPSQFVGIHPSLYKSSHKKKRNRH